MDLSTPLGIDCSTTAHDTARTVILSLHHALDMLLQTDLFITRLPCVEPCVSEPAPWHLVATVDQSAAPHSECVMSSSIAGPPVLRASPRLSGFKLFSTRCTLEFWLSVRHDLNHSRTYSTCRPSQSMFLTCRFRGRRAADSSPLCDPKRQPRPSNGDFATCSLQALVHFPLSQVFPLQISGIFNSRHFFPDGQLTACHRLLHPQDLGMEMSHSAPHGASPPLTCQQPWPLRPKLSMLTLGQCVKLSFARACRHHILSCCRRSKEMPAKHHVRRRSRPPGLRASRPVAKKTSTIGCSTCLLYTTKHLGLPFLNRNRRLRACKFLVSGCCIRLASSSTANCSSHLSVTEIAGPHRPRSVASSTLCPSSSEVRTPGELTALLSILSPICDTRIST